MQAYQIRRAAIVLLGLVLIVFAVTQTAKFLSRAGDESSADSTSLAEQRTLPDYAALDSRVRLTYTGEIEGREDYQQIRMTVSARERRLEIMNGYGQSVARSRVLANDQAAYGAFLRTLYLNNFSTVQANQLGDDERGVCFRGERIVGELFVDGERELRLWAASCDKEAGTMAARWRDVLRLFQEQFPDYRDFTRDIRL